MNGITRRGFLGAAAAGTAAAMWPSRGNAMETKDLRIADITIYPVRYPTVMRFKFFEGPTSGGGRPAVLIKITADDGTIGWGESVPIPRWSYETLEAAASTLELYIKPLILGMNPFDLDAIHGVMNREIAGAFSTGMPITKAGVDIALHDLIGKALGKNIAELWGRPLPDTLTLSWTLNPETLDDIEPLIETGKARGFEHFNIKVAPDPEFDLALCRRVKALVPDGFLWADANAGYDLDTALAAIPRLAEAGAAVLEQPIPLNQLTGYQAIRKQGALPIILDEGVISPVEYREFIRLGMCDGIAMKPARCGGLVSAKGQLDVAEEKGQMFLGSGLTDPDVSLAASLILYGAYGLAYPAALNGPQFLGESVLDEPFVPENGAVRVPKGPGLGISVNEDKVRDLHARSKAQG